MSQYFRVHPTHPQPRLLQRAAAILHEGGVLVVPTDSAYALACQLGDKAGQDRIRTIRHLDETHLLTLTCRDLAELSLYARVDNVSYRLLKHYLPGPYTFVLKATREVPRRLQNPRRKSIGLRVPEDPVLRALLDANQGPVMTTTLRLPGDEFPLADPEDMRARLQGRVDLIIDAGPGLTGTTTVVDLTEETPVLVRAGLGAFP